MNSNKFGKLVGKLVEGKKKISSGNFIDEIAGIYKVGENQYKVMRVACGEIVLQYGVVYSGKDFVKVGREFAYSATKDGLPQYVLAEK